MQNSNFDVAPDQSIQRFCEQLLKKRFPNDPIRQEINDGDAAKLNFACPYCGDSQKDPNKKRGNLYLNTQAYKCYNDGCAVWVPLEKFISHFGRKYGLDVPSSAPAKKPEFRPKTSSRKKGHLIEFLINREVGAKLLDFEDIVRRFGLTPCAKADPSSPIGEYVRRRMLIGLPVFEQSCYYDSRHDKIYIFNLDLRSGKILGFALRKISDSAIGPKYNIKNYSEFKKAGLTRDLEEDFVQKVDSINNYFNLLNINFSQDVTVTEGQIDTMFIQNCIATTGVTKSKTVLGSLITKKKARILFDNDRAGKEQTIEFLKQGYRVFLWNKLIFSLKIKHPTCSREIRQIKDVNDLYRFLAQHEEINFEKFNRILDAYFSDSAFDLLLV